MKRFFWLLYRKGLEERGSRYRGVGRIMEDWIRVVTVEMKLNGRM